MKVFLLANSFPDKKNKAQGIFNYRMVKQMKEMGQEVTVTVFRMLLPGRKLIENYLYDGIKVTQVCLPLIPIDNYFFIKINNSICRFFGWQLLKRRLITCDVIHSVYLTTSGACAGYWAKKLKIPHLAQAIGSDVNSDMQYIRNNTLKAWMKNIHGIITNSKSLEKEIECLCPTAPEIRTIYRGISIEQRALCNSDKSQIKGVSFLFLGGLTPYKRLKYGVNTKGGITLMESWKMVEKELSLMEAKLFFGGPHSDNTLFWKWRNSLEYPQNVELIGEIAPDEVKKYVEKSSVVLIPSMEEGLPNFLLESYANGKPAIGSNAGGIPEVIVNQKTGFIFKKGNVNQLAELLILSAGNMECNKVMGESAYARVKTYFDANCYGNNIINFYRNLIEKCAE